MKLHIAEISSAVAFGAIWFASLWAQSFFDTFPHWRSALSLIIFCVFAAYIAIIDGERRPTKSHLYRTATGVFAGVTIAAVNQAPIEGYFLGALIGGLLGWLGKFWVKHL